MTNIVAIIVAAGKGVRMKKSFSKDQQQATDLPKQYMNVSEKTVLEHSLAPFLEHPHINSVLCVIDENHKALYHQAIDPHTKILPPVIGGKTRQSSVRNALQSLMDNEMVAPDYVLIHDAARPLVNKNDIDAVIEPLKNGIAKGATLSLKVSDSFRRGYHKNRICFAAERVLRDNLYALQTPQGFHFETLYEAHIADGPNTHTDDTSLLSEKDIDIVLAEGRMMNLKVTTADDLEIVKKMLAS